MDNLRIDADRLWGSLTELAEIGATPKGGVRRLTLTEEDRRARDLFARWAREAGLSVEVDAIGNIFARRAGADPSLPPVAMGSHLDSQPSGGKFDGAYGVIAGLEVLRTLNDAGVATRAPMEVVSWTNEEGSRFQPVMMGSGVFANVFTLEHVRAQKDLDGVAVGDALQAIGYAGAARPHRLGAYFEAHIEQGPVLENENKTIGVVQGALGQRWYDVTVTGQDAHAGPTPMELRRDALIGASRLVLEVNRIARTFPDYARGTVGFMQVKPNSRNVIPGEVRTSVDFRNAKAATLDAMCEELKRVARVIEGECRVAIELRETVYFKPCEFDAGLVASVREAAGALGYSHRDIVSGAGHDAVYVARVAPTAMIFIPCEGGISHNEMESAALADLTAGGNVLLHAALRKAGIAGAARAAA
ncbi:MAG: Zn-dependent hydrolase [Betaproteobacteria bacterium]|nr:Zn-dependent hydrolase [Betaproteobacteria bacterium]MDH4322573.1 Zn-dependent hydrolase [Betaproteobacteria bacterium]MDH5212251.1 Zn-dependent hydrolase [Betaproteobacteria bacterium]